MSSKKKKEKTEKEKMSRAEIVGDEIVKKMFSSCTDEFEQVALAHKLRNSPDMLAKMVAQAEAANTKVKKKGLTKLEDMNFEMDDRSFHYMQVWVIDGLQKRADLNGTVVTVIRPAGEDHPGRIRVQALRTEEFVAVQPQHLKEIKTSTFEHLNQLELGALRMFSITQNAVEGADLTTGGLVMKADTPPGEGFVMTDGSRTTQPPEPYKDGFRPPKPGIGKCLAKDMVFDYPDGVQHVIPAGEYDSDDYIKVVLEEQTAWSAAMTFGDARPKAEPAQVQRTYNERTQQPDAYLATISEMQGIAAQAGCDWGGLDTSYANEVSEMLEGAHVDSL